MRQKQIGAESIQRGEVAAKAAKVAKDSSHHSKRQAEARAKAAKASNHNSRQQAGARAKGAVHSGTATIGRL